jgi:methyl-accepting chemotaxis protein
VRISQKMILAAILFSAIPIFIACTLVGYIAVSKSFNALETVAQERLISLRDVRKQQIGNYIMTIENQMLNLSGSNLVVDAMEQFGRSALSLTDGLSDQKIADWRKQLSQYYVDQFGQEFNRRNPGVSFDVDRLYSELDPLAVSMQYRYIQSNSHPIGEKDSLYDPEDGSDYAKKHSTYHPFFRDFLQRFGYYDIFLVELDSGRIVYSVFKELDYATSLKSGPYANSGIGRAFQKASAIDASEQFAFDDFDAYVPSYQDPAAFIASPIFKGDKKIGVLIFQMPIDRINSVMTQDHQWKEAGLGTSGETYLVGPDSKMRSISRFLIEDKEGYLGAIKDSGLSDEIVSTIDAKGTSIGLQPVNSAGSQAALAGETGFSDFSDYRGVPVFSAYTPIELAGERWAILAEIDKDEALSAATALKLDLIYLILAICAGLAGFSIFGGILYARSLSRPIVELSNVIHRVEEESDLTLQAIVYGKGELGMAASAFNAMVQKFQGSLRQVNEATSRLGDVAQRSSSNADLTNQAIQVQVEQTEQAANAMNQMNIAVREVSSNIHSTSAASQQMNEQAVQGRQSMAEAGNQIKHLVDEVERASAVIARLETNSHDIGRVLDVIKGIAEQTNLLALNAAIEAARAGEQGRGFAVVADEVRTLASRTQESTEEINTIIETLRQGAKEAVLAMDSSRDKARVAVDKAGAIDSALQLISDSINKINDMSSGIATSAEEQSAVAEEINSNFDNINSMTHQTAEGAAKSSHAGTELKGVVTELQSMVAQFKV